MPGSFAFRSIVATSRTALTERPPSAHFTAASMGSTPAPRRQPMPIVMGFSASVAVVTTGAAPVICAKRLARRFIEHDDGRVTVLVARQAVKQAHRDASGHHEHPLLVHVKYGAKPLAL